MEPEILEQLINYAYTGRVRIAAGNVEALLMGASFLQLAPILSACSAYLQTRLQVTTVEGLEEWFRR